ncbi:MAG TPA: hypothetical protein VFG12_11175 [Rhodopila sp.]|jgi:urea transport system ATP-binding protein|nr:hypothetical protein [Rhodopila sp.]
MILLDAPTEGLQPNIVKEIEHIIVRWNLERGSFVLPAEPNTLAARTASRRLVIMKKARSRRRTRPPT